MNEYCFRVADFIFSLRLPGRLDVARLLPSFLPFRCGTDVPGERLFTLTALPAGDFPAMAEGRLLEETRNDMGLVRLYALEGGYRVTLTWGGATHGMWADAGFSSVRAAVRWERPGAGTVLSSMLRTAYSQAVLREDAVSLHASAVCLDGLAYLFMGKSGTGKSTHSALWLEHFPGAELLNDDNPTVRLVDGRAVAYGTPWSGKTPCYRPLSFPVGGMVRLRQAAENAFSRLDGADAFVALYPGCSVITLDAGLCEQLCGTVFRLAGLVPVGRLDCLPDRGAALLCRRELERLREVYGNS